MSTFSSTFSIQMIRTPPIFQSFLWSLACSLLKRRYYSCHSMSYVYISQRLDVLKSLPVGQQHDRSRLRCWMEHNMWRFGHGNLLALCVYGNYNSHPLSLAIHDIFPNPEEGGQAPYTIYKLAQASGLFEKLPMVNTLGLFRKI